MQDRLANNFLFLLANNVLSPVFSMALVLAISRLKGVEMLGKYSLMMTVFTVGQSCAPLGLTVIITREVAKARHLAGHYFVNACAVTAGLIALALLVMVPAVWVFLGEPEMRVAISLTLLSLMPSIVMGYGEGVLLALGRAGGFVTVGIAENLARAGIGTLLVLLGFGLPALAWSLLVLRALAGIVLVLVLWNRGVGLGARFDRGLWRELLAQVPVVGTTPIVYQIYNRSDILLLTWLGSWSDVGLYSAGLRLVDIARTLPAAYSRALYPILSRVHGEAAEFRKAAQRSVRQCVLMVTPVTVVMSGLSPVLITRLYGSDAAGGATSLAILSCSLIPLAVVCVLAQVMLAAGRQGIDLRMNVVNAVVCILANALLIPRLGATGAAIAMLGSISVFAALQYAWLRRHAFDSEILHDLAKVVAIAVASAVVMAVLLKTSAFAAIIAGLATCATAALAAGLVTRGDLHAWHARIGSVGARRL